MINVIFELALIDNVVDFFADTLDAAFSVNLTNDKLIEFGLAKLKALVDGFRAVSDDIFKL